jgi:hypothetical protein
MFHDIIMNFLLGWRISKTSFGSVIKFYYELRHVNEIWPRNIHQKKPWSWRTSKKTNFRKFWEGMILARFQKPLFGTPDNILAHPQSQFLVSFSSNLRSLQENRVGLSFNYRTRNYPTGLGTIPIGKSNGVPLENVPKFRVHNLTP